MLHVIIVVLLVRFVVVEPEKDRRNERWTEVTWQSDRPMILDEPPPEPPKEPPERTPDWDAPAVEVAADPWDAQALADAATVQSVEMADLRTETFSPMGVPLPITSLRPGLDRDPVGKHNPPGTTRRIKASMSSALLWLQRNQRDDGSWEGVGGAASAVGMTGMALVAFLSHGETHQSQAFGGTVRGAIDFLIAQQQPDGSFLSSRAGQGHARTYANGMAAYALGEAYALTRIPSLRPVMENGVRYILQGMQDTGGFTYAYARTERRDTSVAGWQVQAMKAAYLARAEVPGLREQMERAAGGMKLNYVPDRGMFRYAPPEGNDPNPTCTAIGVLSLQLLGHASDVPVSTALRTLAGIRCDWTEPGVGNWPLYTWYYLGQALLHSPRPGHFAQWNRGFAEAMLRHQNADGSWTPRWGAERDYGPVYGTVFGATSLMVYYKQLQVLKDAGQEEAFDETQADDILIEFS